MTGTNFSHFLLIYKLWKKHTARAQGLWCIQLTFLFNRDLGEREYMGTRRWADSTRVLSMLLCCGPSIYMNTAFLATFLPIRESQFRFMLCKQIMLYQVLSLFKSSRSLISPWAFFRNYSVYETVDLDII